MKLEKDIIFGLNGYIKISLFDVENSNYHFRINLKLSYNKDFIYFTKNIEDIATNTKLIDPTRIRESFSLIEVADTSAKIINELTKIDLIEEKGSRYYTLPDGYNKVVKVLEDNNIDIDYYLLLIKHLYFYKQDMFDVIDVFIDGKDYVMEWNKIKKELFKNYVIFLYTDYQLVMEQAIKIDKELISNIFLDYDQISGEYLDFNIELKNIESVDKDYVNNEFYINRNRNLDFLKIKLKTFNDNENINPAAIRAIADILSKQILKPIKKFLNSNKNKCLIDLKDLDVMLMSISKILDINTNKKLPEINILDYVEIRK